MAMPDETGPTRKAMAAERMPAQGQSHFACELRSAGIALRPVALQLTLRDLTATAALADSSSLLILLLGPPTGCLFRLLALCSACLGP
jgi:hypothetical protein